jgi:ATP-binding cassette, subfamily G (WHITE), eye pigment precursor transporter
MKFNNSNRESLKLTSLDNEPIAVSLTWQNINVHLKAKNTKDTLSGTPFKKQILRNVNGIARPGELLAIMGASGAGKTTLLNTLTFRTGNDLQIQSDVKVNGYRIDSQKQLAAVAGYVKQDDVFISTLKVREHLVFQVKNKNTHPNLF